MLILTLGKNPRLIKDFLSSKLGRKQYYLYLATQTDSVDTKDLDARENQDKPHSVAQNRARKLRWELISVTSFHEFKPRARLPVASPVAQLAFGVGLSDFKPGISTRRSRDIGRQGGLAYIVVGYLANQRVEGAF